MSSIVLNKHSSSRNILAGILGNVLEHYDNALYSLLVPFIAPVFFTDLPYTTGLILAYGIQVIGILMRPLGALVFGYIGDRHGRKRALSLTIIGMAIVTVLMGCMPTGLEIGFAAPILLVVLRGMQNFFAGGEVHGGVIFMLEHSKPSWRGFWGSIYASSTILGIMLASGLVALFAGWNIVESHWRLLFWLGALSGILGFVMRSMCDETVDYHNAKATPSGLFSTLKNNRRAIAAILLTAGFSYVTYAIPFTLMNGFLPLISSISKAEAVAMNTGLLFMDMLLLPVFGLLTRWIDGVRLMRMAAMALAILAIPLFSLLREPSMTSAIIARTTIVIIGVAFAAPLHQWTLNLVPIKDRYVVTSFGSSLGTQIMGAPCAAICLWLYQITNWVIAPAFYLLLAALVTVFVLKVFTNNRDRISVAHGE